MFYPGVDMDETPGVKIYPAEKSKIEKLRDWIKSRFVRRKKQ